MKRVCTNCEQITAESSEWCQNRECPAGTLSTIFDYGETLGDLTIVRLMRILRTSAVYEATRGKDSVIVKVAHTECSEQLKREAILLRDLAKAGKHPMLPELLPAYQYGDATQRPYGKLAIQGETRYYLVLKHLEGDFLRDLLVKTPQPWYQHAAWLSVTLADAVAFVNVKASKLVLNLSPDSVIVRTDRDGVLRPILVDLSMASDPQSINHEQVKRFIPPSYTAPELLEPGTLVGPGTDVYGLGVLMYEMLAGEPAYPFRMRRPDEVREAVRRANPPTLSRSDLAEDVVMLVNQAIAKSPARRQPDVVAFARALRQKFGEVPAERKGFRPDRRTVALGVFATLVVVAWVVLSALLV